MHAGKQPFTGQRCLSRSNVYQHMHPCVSDFRFSYGNLISCFATPSLPCIGDEEGLFLLGNCRRDISGRFKTYGLSKCSEHICDEVDLLLCRGGGLNIHIFFLFWQQSSQLITGNLDERVNGKGAITWYLSDASANASGSIFYLYERMNVPRCKISFFV